MRYHFRVHTETKKGNTIHWAECIEINGIFTQSSTLHGLHAMMKEALSLHLLELKESGLPIPAPRIITGEGIIEIQAIDLRQMKYTTKPKSGEKGK